MTRTADLNRPYRGTHGVIREYNIYINLFVI